MLTKLENKTATKAEMRAERETQQAFLEGLLHWMDRCLVGTFPPVDGFGGVQENVRDSLRTMTNDGADPMPSETARHWISGWVEDDLKDISEGAFEALDRFPGDGADYAEAQAAVDRKMVFITAEAPGFAGMGAQEFFNFHGQRELGSELRRQPTYAPAAAARETVSAGSPGAVRVRCRVG